MALAHDLHQFLLRDVGDARLGFVFGRLVLFRLVVGVLRCFFHLPRLGVLGRRKELALEVFSRQGLRNELTCNLRAFFFDLRVAGLCVEGFEVAYVLVGLGVDHCGGVLL